MTKRPWVEELYSHLPQKTNTQASEPTSETTVKSTGLEHVVNFLEKKKEREQKRLQAEQQMKDVAIEAYKKTA